VVQPTLPLHYERECKQPIGPKGSFILFLETFPVYVWLKLLQGVRYKRPFIDSCFCWSRCSTVSCWDALVRCLTTGGGGRMQLNTAVHIQWSLIFFAILVQRHSTHPVCAVDLLAWWRQVFLTNTIHINDTFWISTLYRSWVGFAKGDRWDMIGCWKWVMFDNNRNDKMETWYGTKKRLLAKRITLNH